MSYEFKPMFPADEEEAMSNMDETVKLLHGVAKLGFQFVALKTALDIDALIHNLKGELADNTEAENELELVFPSERTPEQTRRARGLERVKQALRLAEAAAAACRVYDNVTGLDSLLPPPSARHSI